MKRTIIIGIIITATLQLFANNNVAITEIMYDTPLNEDTTKFLHNYGEFIELYNNGSDVVDLSGWKLKTITPYQEFTFPLGTSLSPHVPMVIAYGDTSFSIGDMTEEEYMNGMTDVHWLYEINDLNLFPIILQTSLILPNQYTTLLLKDAYGITQDSVIYESPGPESLDNARNVDTGLVDAFRGCLKTMYSLQRQRVRVKYDGEVVYISSDWFGKFTNQEIGTYPPNSVGVVTTSFDESTPEHNQTTNTGGRNFIQEITPLTTMSGIDTSQVLNNPSQAIVKRTFYDAMYRPTLTLLFNQTPNQYNLITLQEYDIYARPTKEWLPIVEDVNSLTQSTFKTNALQYYSGESRPFIEQCYSTATWANGTIKNELVGTQKAGADMGEHKTQYVSRGNTDNEVKLFFVTPNGQLRWNDYYFALTLRVTETTDEDNITKVVYTNLRDQVVMEKIDNANTYYVYNDLNQLCYVLPPLAANQLAEGTYNEDNDVLKRYAYVYKYDERGNQIYKRLPGCDPIIMEYDSRNLLVASQTGNQRSRGDYWTTNTYDDLCRLVQSKEVNRLSSDIFEPFPGGDLQMPLSSTYNLQPGNDYIQNAINSNLTLLSNRYDNYLFLQVLHNPSKSYLTFEAFEDNPTYANPKGLLTNSRIYHLDGSGIYSETVYYYDYRGREIQRRTINHLGGYDVFSTKYDFTNNVTDTWSSQSTNNGLTITEHYHYTYDHANRLLTTTYTFNNEPPIELQSYHYDELGRVRSRHIHSGSDSVAFNYDIRNQVTQIKSSGYEQKYYYNQSCSIAPDFSGGLYNGNISATTWTYGNQTNGYVYRYDKMNRLESNYSILNGSLNADYLYSESFIYDAQGNITNLTRWDNNDLMDYLQLTYDGNQLVNVDDNGFGSYEYATKQYHDNNTEGNDFAYDANGNMLYDKDRGIAAICYNLLNLPDTIQFMNGNQIIHRYDAAGNRLNTTYYTRKVNITVPLGEIFSATDSLSNYYITREAFHNNVVYNIDNANQYGMEFVHNPEGYIRYYGPEEHYHFYYIKDLLGNIRETYVHPEAEYKECIQRMQYYPSGLPWAEAAGSSEQPWKYNGKEFVEMHGLDEYDSKARWYYPAICRTTTMDPLAEKYYATSPYAWCGNNPVRFVDPDGKKIVVGTWYGRMFAKLGIQNFEAKVTNQLATLKGLDLEINNMITSLEDSPTKFYIEYYTNKNNHYNPGDNTVGYDPDDYFRRNGEKRPPEAALAHELGHAADDKDGKIVKYNPHIANGETGTPKEQSIEQEKRDRNEVNSIYYENIVREKEGYPQRGYNYSAGD